MWWWQSTTARLRAGVMPAPIASLCLVLAVGTACLLIAGCSPGAEYPSIFPAVHEMPPPRAEAPMDQLQVQKAEEDLITQRNHLNAEAPPASGQAKTTADTSANQTANSTAKPAAKKKAAAHKAKPQQTVAAPPATTASAQTAGADLKP